MTLSNFRHKLRTEFARRARLTALTLLGGVLITQFVTQCAAGGVSVGNREAAHIQLPFVRVLLSDDAQSVTIGGLHSIAIECVRGDEKFVYYSPRSIHAKFAHSSLSLLNSSGEEIESGLDVITISSRSQRQPLLIDGNSYRGMARLTAGDKTIVVTNILNIDKYLMGVVPPEIGPVKPSDVEAIKAQAISARTYTMAHFGQYGGRSYDVTAEVSDQLYRGMRVEKDFISEAVLATAGEVIRYNGHFIKAYYHSTCGGRTDNIENVWPKAPAPYLKSVDCHESCSPSKYYNWQETFTGKQLAKRLSDFETASGEIVTIGRIDSIYIDNSQPASPSKGLRTQKLIFLTDAGRFVYIRDRIRWVVRRSSNKSKILQSAYFTLSAIQQSPRAGVTSVTFSGHGYGHGVGLCQMGALGMARSKTKYTYRDIIKRYYTAVTIDKLY
ncbi:SpoIID/LytB domain-containing protein [bacterium AH-315-J21]|nr:SpoIID/LytB domain-containing protein [bacterium AH-315-J21]